jgi:hypothetical protein
MKRREGRAIQVTDDELERILKDQYYPNIRLSPLRSTISRQSARNSKKKTPLPDLSQDCYRYANLLCFLSFQSGLPFAPYNATAIGFEVY